MGEVVLQLTPSETRDLKTREVADMWREANGPIADAVELKFNSSLFTAGNDIDIQLEGEDVDELRDIAERLRFKLAEYPGVVDITDSFRSGKQELKLDILPSGEALGLSLGDLARQVRQAFFFWWEETRGNPENEMGGKTPFCSSPFKFDGIF